VAVFLGHVVRISPFKDRQQQYENLDLFLILKTKKLGILPLIFAQSYDFNVISLRLSALAAIIMCISFNQK
jgi:hypothetical protein